MIRRAFLRRMAHAAMAGMLGVELLTRAPRFVDDPDVVRYYTSKAVEGPEIAPPSCPTCGREVSAEIWVHQSGDVIHDPPYLHCRYCAPYAPTVDFARKVWRMQSPFYKA